MSEFQYYEFQTIDRPLTPEEQVSVRRLSSHIDVAASRAVVTYDYGGDFKHSPLNVVARFFDAMLFQANWGSSQLIFRFPRSAVDVARVKHYLVEDVVTLHESGSHLLIEMTFEDEDRTDWIEGEGSLSSLIPLRQAMLDGDHRLLYLAWLKAMTISDPDLALGRLEPPVPPGLGKFTPEVQAFAEIFGVNPLLIRSAGEASPDPADLVEAEILRGLSQLSRGEMEEFLLRLLRREPRVDAVLRRRLLELAGGPLLSVKDPPRRTYGDLERRVDEMQAEERRKMREAVERRRIQEINDLAPRAEQAWGEVEQLIGNATSKSYEEAVRLLVKLKNLADFQNDRHSFDQRLSDLRDRYAKRRALMERFKKARLA